MSDYDRRPRWEEPPQRLVEATVIILPTAQIVVAAVEQPAFVPSWYPEQ